MFVNIHDTIQDKEGTWSPSVNYTHIYIYANPKEYRSLKLRQYYWDHYHVLQFLDDALPSHHILY